MNRFVTIDSYILLSDKSFGVDDGLRSCCWYYLCLAYSRKTTPRNNSDHTVSRKISFIVLICIFIRMITIE